MSETNGRVRILYHLARADFLERVRRYSFILTIGISIYLGYAAATGQLEMRVGDSRGVFNSAWIGGLMALVCSTFLSLAGFYVVKNTIERDRLTRVGEILASTPMSKTLYVMGKVLSNFLVLAVMVVILAISGIIMQVWHAEAPRVDLWKLLGPFLLIVLPAMALVAAVAVLFETIPGLRGSFGNVLYFFVWSVALAVPISASENNRSSFLDWAGLSVIWSSIRAAAKLPANHFSFSLSIGSRNQAQVGSPFQWNGVQWTPELILARLSWIVVALALALLAAWLFDRFDPSKERSRRAITAPTLVPPEAAENLPLSRKPIHAPPLTPLTNRQSSFRFGAILLAELRLTLQGQKWWWYAVAAGLLVACAATPSASARGMLLACAWFWPVLIWSKMGMRETRDQSAHFLCATSDSAATSGPLARRRGARIADRKRIRRALVVHRKLARPVCVADRRALYSYVSVDLWRMERLEQAVRNSLHAALVRRAHACNSATRFHGLCPGNGKHKRTHFLLRVCSGDGCHRHSRPQTPITDLKVRNPDAP
jgi:hypothetical protein